LPGAVSEEPLAGDTDTEAGGVAGRKASTRTPTQHTRSEVTIRLRFAYHSTVCLTFIGV
jgi:hypothetical protein